MESLIGELLNFRHLEMPTFSEELRLQTSLDEVFLQIDTERVHESLVKGHRMRRLKELPARQLACISLMLENTNYRMAEDERLLMMTGLRQVVLRRSRQTHPLGKDIWSLALFKQLMDMPLSEIMMHYHEATKPMSVGLTALLQYDDISDKAMCQAPYCLNEFLRKVPCFRAGYEVSNKSVEAVAEYIRIEIDPELDLITVGIVGIDNGVSGSYSIPRDVIIEDTAIDAFAQEKGFSLSKSVVLKHNGRTLFFSELLKKTPSELGI